MILAIVIGDIHGSLLKATAFLAYCTNEEHIALGDLVDSRTGASADEELSCLDLLLESDAVLSGAIMILPTCQKGPGY